MGASSWAGSFRRYSYGALFALLPDPEATFGTTLQQVHAGPGCHTTLGFLPTGHAWGDPASGGGAGGRGQVGPHLPLAGVGVLPSAFPIWQVGPHPAFTATLYYNLRHDELAQWKA